MIKIGNPKRLVMAGVTLGCALGIGYFMQSSTPKAAVAPAPQGVVVTGASVLSGGQDVQPVREMADSAESSDSVGSDDLAALDAIAPEDAMFSEAAPAQTDPVDESFAEELGAESVTLTSAEADQVISAPAAAPQPESLPAAPVQIAALGDAPIGELPKEEPAPAIACEMAMTATPVAAAMVMLTLEAPCMASQQFTIHHNGMMFSALTDTKGDFAMDVPALSENAVFIAAFDNGEGAVATTEVDMLAYYDRYVVQWKGESGLQIHALEYGAEYGEDGHVWHDAARDMAVAVTGEGGFMLRLGEGQIEEGTLWAEVYTFPTQNAQREGEVALSLEAEVNAANCGRDIEAQALVRQADGVIDALDLELAIPDCDAVGDFLVLKNLYEDLKIARN